MSDFQDSILGDDIDWEYSHDIEPEDLIQFEFEDSIE